MTNTPHITTRWQVLTQALGHVLGSALGLARRPVPINVAAAPRLATRTGLHAGHAVANKTDMKRACRPLASHPAAPRPLRVIRCVDVHQAPSLVGRMVISGRMADVCAELDRLAACDTAVH